MGKAVIKDEKSAKEKNSNGKPNLYRTLGPISDLEKHLPAEWWKNLFNSIYLKTDGDVVENQNNTAKDIDLILRATGIEPSDVILDLCCGQGRHSIELAKRGYQNIAGIDRSKFLIRLARKRAQQYNLKVQFSEGDARKIKYGDESMGCVLLMGNSFGYFEKNEDDAAVLQAIRRVLKSKGILVLDLVDGEWMRKNFEPRSWEWIDQNHLVCRERTLSGDKKRIVSREVVVHAEEGILTDQFYAERLYEWEAIQELLELNGFSDITLHGNICSESLRNQDLGMMANRLFITATGPEKVLSIKKTSEGVQNIIVIMGDPHLPDKVKKDGQYNPEDFNTINTLKSTLQKLKNYKFTYFDNHKKLLTELSHSSPTLVLNLCDEGFLNDAFKELHIPALLEMHSIPYTGAGPGCLAMCYNKALVRALATNLDIPVPLETYINPTDQAAAIPSIFPALLKPNTGDSSIGITQEAVVYNAEQLITYLDKMKQLLPGCAVLVQEFLSGREFSVALLGNVGSFTVLPILEVDYSRLPAHLPKILSYESKWLPDSPYWNDIRYKPAELHEEAKRQLIDYSTLLFERLECRDYARFDFREDTNGVIKLLEVNPNPGWCWDGKMNLMAGFNGMSYSEMIEMIINSAKERLEITA